MAAVLHGHLRTMADLDLILGLDDLIQLKRKTGRAIDQEDAVALEVLREPIAGPGPDDD